MNKINHFEFYVQKVLPTVYDDSLSYYELLTKVVKHLNDVGETTNELIDLYAEVTDWVDKQLDDHVRVKLNEWSLDGTLDKIINEEIFTDLNTSLNRLDAINDTVEINVLYPPIPLVGVVADGTDQSKIIQNILDLALDHPIKVYFPDGVYGVGDYLHWRGSTEIELSQNAILKRVSSINKIFQNGEQANYSYAFLYNGDSNLYLHGGKIDLNSSIFPVAPEESITCFNIGHAQNVLVENIEITNGQNGHYFQISSSKDVTIRDSKFTNQRNTGTSNIYEVIQIEIMTATSFPSFGGYDLTPCENINIENNVFENVIRGVGTHGDAKYNGSSVTYSNNINIKNNTFRNVSSFAIGMAGYRNSTIDNNNMENVYMHAIWIRNSEKIIVTNNKGDKIYWSGIETDNVNDSTFRDNDFYDVGLDTSSGRSGIRCYATRNSVFDNNKIHSLAPKYAYAQYFSDDSLGNKVINERYTKGTFGTIYASDATQLNSLVTGSGRQLLFDGDGGTVGQTLQLSDDWRLYSAIVVVANNNDGNGLMTTMVIPKDMYNLSSAEGRFRIITGTGGTDSFQIDFSTPTVSTLRIDAISGNGHIRKVIGLR